MLTGKEDITVGVETDATPFEYGWCHTDRKDGKELRQMWRVTDYMSDEPYATQMKEMMEKLGLPVPDTSQVFRGTHHDLLFLDSHGVVVRIGPLDVNQLMVPGIIQPLGWLESSQKIQTLSADNSKICEFPMTIAVYPGVSLLTNATEEVLTFKQQVGRKFEQFLDSFAEFSGFPRPHREVGIPTLTAHIENSGLYANDVNMRNSGSIIVI